MLRLSALAERLLVSTLVRCRSSSSCHVAHWPSSRGTSPVGHRLRLGALLELVAGRGSVLVPLLLLLLLVLRWLLAVLGRVGVRWGRVAIASYRASRSCQRRRDGIRRRGVLLSPAVLLLLGIRLPSSLVVLLLAHVVDQRGIAAVSEFADGRQRLLGIAARV